MSDDQTGGAKPKPTPQVTEVVQPFKGNTPGVTGAGTSTTQAKPTDSTN